MTDHQRLCDLTSNHRFGVTHNVDGWKVFEIDRIDRNVVICRLKHDTSRPDPTLVADVLSERHDPDKEHSIFVAHFLAIYGTLDTAIKAIETFESRYGWQRQHFLDCKKAVETAKRNLHTAEQCLIYTGFRKLDTFGAKTQDDISRVFSPVTASNPQTEKENTMTTTTIIDPQTEKSITVTLTTRDEYITQRAAWRKQYRELSDNIRKTKLAIKNANRALDFRELASAQATASVLSAYATEMLEERRIMKLAAKASYDAEREQRLAA